MSHAASLSARRRLPLMEGLRVMLVDDDPECGDMMRIAMEREGIDVTFHARATAALEEIRRSPHRWDALVTDQVMPGMKGLDLVREVRALHAELPCILCTGYAKDIEPAKLCDSGVSVFLHKPVEIGQIIDSLSGVVTDKRKASNDSLGAPARPSIPSPQAMLDEIADIVPTGIFATDADGVCVYANAQMLESAGLSPAKVLGRNWVKAMQPDEHLLMAAEWARALHAARPFRHEFRFFNNNDRDAWFHAYAVPHFGADGALQGFVGTVTSNGERRSAQARMEFLSHHDQLTGLPNRLLARDRMRQAISFAGRAQFKVALLLIDIDHFKDINDSLGHTIGDAVLTATAERLEGCIRETDTVSRLGGDEFLLILTDLHDPDSVAGAAAKILEQVSRPLEIEGFELSCSVSIGISLTPDDGDEFESLLVKADTALHQAKSAGRNAYRFYAERMNMDTRRQLEIRSQLRRAKERCEFVLHYQPVVDIGTGRVVGAEALIRWNHPEHGLIGPNDFISIAEESGLIVPIGEWALHEACRQAAAWAQRIDPPLFVAVNLSAVQFRRDNLEKTVMAALKESGLSPSLLELELTESILISDTENVLNTVERLSAHGVRLSIDDFGTGYSSLSYLKRFKVHKLKIDKSFVAEAHKDPGDAAIVAAVIQLAGAMNLKTVAEGVEEPETLELLKTLRCDLVQGYIYGRPVPADAFPLALTV